MESDTYTICGWLLGYLADNCRLKHEWSARWKLGYGYNNCIDYDMS